MFWSFVLNLVSIRFASDAELLSRSLTRSAMPPFWITHKKSAWLVFRSLFYLRGISYWNNVMRQRRICKGLVFWKLNNYKLARVHSILTQNIKITARRHYCSFVVIWLKTFPNSACLRNNCITLSSFRNSVGSLADKSHHDEHVILQSSIRVNRGWHF